MFPGRNGFYTYRGLVEAAATFPAFAGTGDGTTRRREAAAALANFSHETGGLVYIEEIARGEYCSGTATPCGTCAAGKRYYGRGPTQLSWNYNYCTAGRALGLDLFNNPEQVATNPTTAWRTALWFWMTQTGAGNRTSHAAMTGGGRFRRDDPHHQRRARVQRRQPGAGAEPHRDLPELRADPEHVARGRARLLSRAGQTAPFEVTPRRGFCQSGRTQASTARRRAIDSHPPGGDPP